MPARVMRRGATGRPASPGYRANVLEALTKLLADRRDVKRGKMFGFPAFYTAGKLFACVYGDGVGLKLPQEMVRALNGKPGITPFRPYGKPKMKEWIHIWHDRPETYATDARLLLASIRFVSQRAKRPNKPPMTKRPRMRA